MKKIITILGSMLLLIGISNAYNVVGLGGQIEVETPDTAVIGNYTYVFNNNGNITTDGYGNVLNWYNKQSSNTYNYVYGRINGKLYFVGFYNNSAQKQGFITKFSVCSESEPTNASKCSSLNLTADEFYQLNPKITKLIIGNNSSSNLQSFYGNEPFRLCYFNSNDSQYYCVQNAIRTQGYVDSPLTGSLGFTNIDSLNNGNFGSSPFSPGYTPTQPTQQYTCPTIQQLIDTYPQQYNTGLCYTNNLIYSGGQFTTITPKTIFELYPTYVQLQNDINNYNNYCKAPNTQETCQGAFNGKNEEYTLISKIPQDIMPIQLYAYCNLTLNQDPNSTTCTASTGAINNGIGIDDIIDNIGKTPITVITPGTPPEDEGNGTGSVFDKYTQEEDETKRRNVIQKAEDTIQTMKEIYAKLTGIFRARQGKDGIVPPLITGLIALIILYKLFKK